MPPFRVVQEQQAAEWIDLLLRNGLRDGRSVLSMLPLLADQNLWYSIQWLGQLLVAAGIVWIAWKACQPRAEFKISIRHGTVAVVYGKVRLQILNDLSDIIAKEGLASGTITGYRKSNRHLLKFSPEISPALQQQIRNMWYAGI